MTTHLYKNLYRYILILSIFIFCSPVCPIIAAENRVLHFPQDRSIGKIWVRDRSGPKHTLWEPLGQAKGDVTVPANKAVRLDVSNDAWQAGTPFAGLKPNDIQDLNFWDCPDADDSVLEDISTLSGLQELDLQDTQVQGTGLKHLLKLKNLRWLRLSSTHVGDNELASLTGLTSLEWLHLSLAPIGNAGMEHISKIITLKSLYIAGTTVDDDGLENIKNLTSLHTLDLGQDNITDEGLKRLSGLVELEDLDLRETQISNAGLVHLRQMKKLKRLILTDTKIGDEGLEHLKHLESLENLSLPFIAYKSEAGLAKLLEEKALVTDVGLAHLSELKTLTSLFVLSDSITEKGVEALAKVESLEFLNIGGRNINDACMVKLAEHPFLKEFWIQHSIVTNEGLANLKNLKSLTKLLIGNGNIITGEGLAFIHELPNLVELELHNLYLGRAGLSSLAGAMSLERLELYIQIKDEDLAGLPELNNLKRLNIDSDEITNEGLRYLARQKTLETLVLSGPGITDAGLSYLEGLNSLKYLTLRNTKVTEQGLVKLKEKIPALSYQL